MMGEKATLWRHTERCAWAVIVCALASGAPGVPEVCLVEQACLSGTGDAPLRDFRSTRRGVWVPFHIRTFAASDVCEWCSRDAHNSVAGPTGRVHMRVAFEGII